jgi:hypothetical protein
VIKLLLPNSKQTAQVNKQQVTLSVTSDHQYFLNTTPVTFEGLPAAITEAVAGLGSADRGASLRTIPHGTGSGRCAHHWQPDQGENDPGHQAVERLKMTYAAPTENATQRRSLAMGISLLLHAALILFIILWKILTPIPPFAEGGGMGMVVDIGFSDVGMGDNPENMEPAPTEQAAAPPVQQEEQVMTEESDEATVSAPEPKKPQPEKPKKPEPVKVKEPTISKGLQQALGAWDQKAEARARAIPIKLATSAGPTANPAVMAPARVRGPAPSTGLVGM